MRKTFLHPNNQTNKPVPPVGPLVLLLSIYLTAKQLVTKQQGGVKVELIPPESLLTNTSFRDILSEDINVSIITDSK